MEYSSLEKILSKDRLAPYLAKHSGNQEKAIAHYKANIRISESFYSVISIIEVGLRNNIDNQLKRKYSVDEWYDDPLFIKDVSSFQIDRIQEARKNILKEKKTITPGRIIAELTFGFWTSLFDTRFERSLWKNLRLAFPKCPKQIRQRKTISSKLNSIRKLRNRIFHHEPIAWNVNALVEYKNEFYDVINWLDGDLTAYFDDTFRVEDVIATEILRIK